MPDVSALSIRPGDRLRLGLDEFDRLTLSFADHELASLRFMNGSGPRIVLAGGRTIEFTASGEAWHVVDVDRDGRATTDTRATEQARTVTLGDRSFTLVQPDPKGSAALTTATGDELLRFEPGDGSKPTHLVVDVVRTPPRDLDGPVLVAFTAYVVALRGTFTPPKQAEGGWKRAPRFGGDRGFGVLAHVAGRKTKVGELGQFEWGRGGGVAWDFSPTS